MSRRIYGAALLSELTRVLYPETERCALARVVTADEFVGPTVRDNASVRLIRRNRPVTHSLAEGECYERTYRENLLGNVDLVLLEHQDVPVRILSDADDRPQLTSRALKRQFEERLAARARNRPSRKS